MSDTPTILLTGFTGVLGKRCAYQLAKKGIRVLVPVRAGSEADAKDRMEKIFMAMSEFTPDFDPTLVRMIEAVPGDVREKELGMPATTIATLEKNPPIEVWHLAARIDLTESSSRDVYMTNLVGTRNVIDLVRKLKVPELHYFSTYGASGEIRQGVVREIPGIRPPSFRNTYERSKWEAEQFVWQAMIRGEMSGAIYRPSIIVGDSVYGRYEQFNALNHVFDVVSRVRDKLCEKKGLDPKTAYLDYELRVLGDRRATLNIVPMDYVVNTVMKLHAIPTSRGRVYHIVNPFPPMLDQAERIFKENVSWKNVRWERFDPKDGFNDPYEKFIAKQMEFLTPYLLGEAIYDHTNVQTVLAMHGGLPPIDNETFLNAIIKRGRDHGWQEERQHAPPAGAERKGELEENFQWPEQEAVSIDYTPSRPVEALTPTHYPVADRLLGKVYRVRERLMSGLRAAGGKVDTKGRDIVIVPFGLGMTRRGEAEMEFYQGNSRLAQEVFGVTNQIVGFDLRSFSKNAIPGHEIYGDLHDNGCWSVSDDIIHLVRLFRDLQKTGCTGFHSRIQILPFSAGTYLAGWLSGILAFEDMVLLTHQAMYLMSECERLTSWKEIEHWFFNPRAKLSETEKIILNEVRAKKDPEGKLDQKGLRELMHGRLELVFSLNSGILDGLIQEVRDNRIAVSPAIRLSPNTIIFAGNELEMARFRKLFGGRRKIELRRVPVDIRGTPHFARLKEAANSSVELLKLYDAQGRLRDPIIPFPSYNGEWVKNRQQFIKAVAGIADQPCNFESMIDRVLKEGGRHFVMIQSGLASTAGDLFEGVIRNNANHRNYRSVSIHQPPLKDGELHPVCRLLDINPEKESEGTLQQDFAATIRWYENGLLELGRDLCESAAVPVTETQQIGEKV